ncbi:MAG: DUF58 domain-containing protein [Thiolinea sp.]
MRAYRQGDSLRQIHWSKSMQTGQLYANPLWITAAMMSGWTGISCHCQASEMRLSYLYGKVLELHQAQRVYGLRNCPARSSSRTEVRHAPALPASAGPGIHDG